MQVQAKAYWKLFKPSACSIGLSGTTPQGVFEELVENFVRGKLLPEEHREPAVQALLEREAIASTGVGRNVAIPHVKLEGIEQVAVSLSLHQEGVEWKSLDGELVHIFFAVLRPDRRNERFDPDRHLDMMRWISQLGRKADFRRFALGVSNRTELVDLLKEMSPA